jgi:hypothetical protein
MDSLAIKQIRSFGARSAIHTVLRHGEAAVAVL